VLPAPQSVLARTTTALSILSKVILWYVQYVWQTRQARRWTKSWLLFDFDCFCFNIHLALIDIHYYGRPLSVSGRPCYILPMFLFIYLFFYGRLILRPWLTEVRESFTRGGPWVSLEKLLLGFTRLLYRCHLHPVCLWICCCLSLGANEHTFVNECVACF